MLNLGTNSIGKMFLGDTEIAKAYLGGDLVYSAGGGSVTPSLPYDSRVEYLQTTGTQYINTGIVQNALNFELTLEIQWSGSTESQFESFFAYMVAGGTTPRCGFHKYQSKWMFGTNQTNSSSSVDSNKHTVFITANSSTGKEQLYIDETYKTQGALTSTGISSNTYPYYIGARNRGSSIDNPCSAKFYSINYKKFSDAAHSTLVQEWNLIPVRVGQVGYMYDTVGEQLLGNSGSGSFTLGNDITT